MPTWLQEVFLGYGDPAGATNLPNTPQTVDFRDTFLSWDHLLESFPDMVSFFAFSLGRIPLLMKKQSIQPEEGTSPGSDPPYIISRKPLSPLPKPPKKRRRDHANDEPPQADALGVRTYRLPNMGPYPIDQPKMNSTRFTPTQIKAIRSGTSPGLTVIVGPPGTGKTEVATQIISNIYRNFPSQRTLLIAHSNHALNQLFEKITALGIDERHLLRLGHGEEGLNTDISYSKQGRVESFMDNRARLLAEVDRLAAYMGAPGAHGESQLVSNSTRPRATQASP